MSNPLTHKVNTSKFDRLDPRIRGLDLSRIIWKMGDPEEGKGFTPQMLARVLQVTLIPPAIAPRRTPNRRGSPRARGRD